MQSQPGTRSNFDTGGLYSAKCESVVFYTVIISVKTDTRVYLLFDQLCQDRLQSRPVLAQSKVDLLCVLLC